MKAGTQNHLKTKRLKRLLKIPLYRAVGILETLWLLCVDCCDEGNIGKFTDDEIADYLEWEGSPSELVRALSDSGWTDLDSHGRPVIHDWLEHCPEFIRDRVRKRIARHSKDCNDHSSRCKTTTYAPPESDKTGQDRTNTGPDRDLTVYVNSIPTQPIPTQPIQEVGAATAAIVTESPKREPPSPDSESTPAAVRTRYRAESVPIPPELNTPDFIAARDAWFKQRRAKRLSLREEHVKTQYERLLPLGPTDAAACLRLSAANDYDGIFPERFSNERKRNGAGSSGQVHEADRHKPVGTL